MVNYEDERLKMDSAGIQGVVSETTRGYERRVASLTGGGGG